MWAMKKVFRKENILLIVSIVIFFYALILNIFFPLRNDKVKSGANKDPVKVFFKDSVERFVPNDVAGLSFGYLLGEKNELPPGVEDKMKTVGLAHIIVVSGTHLSIIVGILRSVFGKISRLSAVYFSIFLLLSYIFLIGFTPSIIRASFVAVLSLFAWYFGRKQLAFRTVIITLGFCLIINPYFLTNVSFQLSMLAYSGVVLILPKFINYFYGRDGPGFFGSVILSSLAAIIACFPVQMYYFGSFNLISIFANLLILPTIPYAMGFSFLTGLFSMMHFDFFARSLGIVSSFILNYHIKIITILEDKSEFLFEVQKNNPWWLVLYVPIVLFVVFVGKKHIEISDDNARSVDKSLV